MNQHITRTEHSAPAQQFTVLLSPTRRGARLARLLAVAHLGDWGIVCEPAAHIVAELAANAAVHGRVSGRDFQLALTVRRDELLRIEVTDTRAEQLPIVSTPDQYAESGRGLLIVEALADRWGIDVGPVPRKTIWAELDLVPRPLHRVAETHDPVNRVPALHDA
ncbi:ATP-binding protein [Streptomyces sp. NBC_00893]|uniref:ATP-binding protein n=1 Tax=Streptomyces sp. NBC_00893 TaxID=2975862 RepID=UPI00224F1C6C|nr:ATP-binding protein [Streptomyces sp. NBC_00893]MCX4845965.1 ATP-binding protein [Streptomyces sp. NBC_00893]